MTVTGRCWMAAFGLTTAASDLEALALRRIASHRCVMAADAAGIPDLPIVAFDFDPKTVGCLDTIGAIQ